MMSGQTATEQRNYVTNAAWAAHGASKTLPLGNGVSETWNWNYRLQPTGVTAGTFSLGYKYCSDSSDTCGTNNGNPVQQTIGHANVTQSYTYDAFGRIADARERVGGGPTDAWVRTYGYDTWGNRWVAAGSGPYMDPFTAVGASNFNAQNQLVLGTAQYDPAGNQTRMGDYTFTYDAENRLKTSRINDSTVTHYYDGEGRRVKRVGPGTRTVVYAYGVDGELAAEYDTEPSTVPGGVQYVAVDHLGSTRAVMNGAGALTRLEDFLPFGEAIPAGIAGRGALYPATAWAEVAGISKRFTGKEREGEVGAGLDYFGARYFSGAQGRWTSPDQINVTNARLLSPSSTLNKYAYAANNPLKYTDPDGRDITVFYWPGAPTGHITMAAYNQDTRDFAYLSVGPQKHLDPAALLYPWAGVPGTSAYLLPQSVDELRQNYASLTIQTSPEVAQQAIDAIRNGAGTGNWALIGNNCTSSVANVLREIGLSPGGPGMIAWQPRVLWANLFSQYAGNSSRQYERSSRYGEDFNRLVIKNEPGKDYGDSRYGMNTFDWLMLMLQAPLKACVTVTDSASGTTSRDCQ